MANGLRDKLAQAGADRGLDVPVELMEADLEVTQEADQDASGAQQAVQAFADTINQLPDVDRMQVIRMVVEQLSV